jgi:DNA-binding NarL/FixJ family response regulator
MEQDPLAQCASKSEPSLRVFILSNVRLLAEGLAQALQCDDKVVSKCSFGTDFQESLATIADLEPELVLLDSALQEGPDAVRRILGVEPRARVVVFGVSETSDNIIAWAQAGVSGYVPRTAALTDVATQLASIMHDEQACSARMAASLLRRLAQSANAEKDPGEKPPALALTAREMQIVELLAAGLSNKDIARRLNIGVATTKSHVHNLLAKLRVQRRGQAALWMHNNSAVSARWASGLSVTTRLLA